MPEDLQTSGHGTSRQRLRWLRRGFAILGVLFMTLMAAAFWSKGRVFEAPEWVEQRVSLKLAELLPDASISFDGIEFILLDNWRPRLSVRNALLTAPDGREVIAVSSARASVHASALFDRQVALRSLELSGVFVQAQRAPDGSLKVSAGLGDRAARREAPDLVAMIGDVDGFLMRPAWQELRHVDVDGITIRFDDQRARRGWTVDGGRLQLRRDGSDLGLSLDLAVLGGGAGVATLSASYAGQIGSRAADFGITFSNLAAQDIATQNPAFAWLQALDAPISGAMRGSVNEEGTFEPFNATLEIGAGSIQPRAEARAIPIVSARSYFRFEPGAQRLVFNAFSIETALGRGLLEGAATLSGESGFDGLIGQFRVTELTINEGRLYDAPVDLEEARMDFRLSLRPFLLEIGELAISDRGRQLLVGGKIGAGSQGWEVALNAGMDALAPDRLVELWPKNFGMKTRRWISENVFAGSLADVNFALRVDPAAPRPVFHVGFDYRDAEVRFMRTMPRVTGGHGHAALTAGRFVAVIDKGSVEAPQGGAVDIAGTSFIVPDVTAREETPGVVRLQTRSSVTAALSLLDRPPFEVMQKANRPVDLAEGQAALKGTLALPLVRGAPKEAITYYVEGVVQDVRTEKLVENRALVSDALSVDASHERVRVAGAGTLDGVPFDVIWEQAHGQTPPVRSTVTGTARLSPETLEAFRIAVPEGSVSGASQAFIDLRLEKGAPPELSLRSDLRGLALSIPEISWRKPAPSEASFTLDARLAPVPEVTGLSLSAPGLTASGEIALTPEGTLDRVRLDSVRVGNWLNAPVDLIGRGQGRAPGVTVRGGRLDLRSANFGQGGGGERVPLSLRLDQLQLTDAITLDDLAGTFTVGGGLQGNFTADVNGQAPINGSVAPHDGRSAIRVTADNAGAVVEAAGALRQARGGALDLLLEPIGEAGAFDGKLTVRDVRITEAPTIAALLNAISIVGLINEMNGDGIYFSTVTADFRLAPSRVTLRSASAEGASMGLSMDGVYQTDTGAIAVQGVISPVYMLNRVGSGLTRAGEGLFGFNYAIRGTTDDPQVSVNPLTAFAPGGIRNLFRAPRPDVPLEEGEVRPPPPPPRPPPVATKGEDR